MKIAVTGSSGRIGQAVVRALLERGDQVRGLDLKPPEQWRFPFTRTDITDFGQVLQGLAGVDAVVHLAAVPGPRLVPPTEIMRVNVQGTYHVLEACRLLGIQRVVLASSINAVGLHFNKERPRLDYLPIDEQHPARPEEAYSLSKWLGEQMADATVRLAPAMAVASLRFHGVTTPEQYERWRAQPFRDVPGDFKGLWGYVDLRDAVDAVLKALEAPFTGHEAFFICAADTHSVVPTAELVAAAYPDVPLRRELRGHEGVFDLSKAKRLLGWEPRYSWRE
ncbi:Uronate dehydrogenase [bacterium HR17]|uniref:Uronate dehydrogenase n=1 Tax=Candidatus Fervidibacter japonicus TaxID=2035412 RepID=A0A2H5X908_9BACT|nr:Uronate dehydrogenase [bacterium HR17]